MGSSEAENQLEALGEEVDAFVAAYIHAHQKWGDKNQYCLDFSLSASAIKNTIPGDQNLVSEEEIINNMTSSGGRIQR